MYVKLRLQEHFNDDHQSMMTIKKTRQTITHAVFCPINVYSGFSIAIGLFLSEKRLFIVLSIVTYFGGGWLLRVMMTFQPKSTDT